MHGTMYSDQKPFTDPNYPQHNQNATSFEVPHHHHFQTGPQCSDFCAHQQTEGHSQPREPESSANNPVATIYNASPDTIVLQSLSGCMALVSDSAKVQALKVAMIEEGKLRVLQGYARLIETMYKPAPSANTEEAYLDESE